MKPREMKTQIKWTKVGERIPSNEGQAFNGSPTTPFVPCLVWACFPGKPHGGVMDCIRWDTKNSRWCTEEISMKWALQAPYEITHFCDDKPNWPGDPDFIDEYERGASDTADAYAQMNDPNY